MEYALAYWKSGRYNTMKRRCIEMVKKTYPCLPLLAACWLVVGWWSVGKSVGKVALKFEEG